MVKITVYRCMNCGANLRFPKGEKETTCEYCAYVNAKEEIKSNFQEIEKVMIDKYADLESQLNDIQSGVQKDVESREWIFNRDYRPRLETSFGNIEEKFEEHFRKPLMNIPSLALLDPKMDMTVVFDGQEWSPDMIKPVVSFWSIELEHPVLKNMAAKKASKNYLEELKLRSNLLSNTYWIRGLSLEFSLENIKTINKFSTENSKIAKKLSETYAKMGTEYEDEAYFYGKWKKRSELYENLSKQLENCLNGEYENVLQEITNCADECQRLIDEAQSLKEKMPLYVLIPLIDGFTTDYSVFSFYQKVVEFIEIIKAKSDFQTILEFIENYLQKINTKFNGIKVVPGWDSEWLTKLEPPLERIFNTLENLAEVAALQKGKKKTIFLGEPSHDFSDYWRVDQLCSTDAMKQTYHVKSRYDAYLPLAAIVSYSILTKGFLWLKAGEGFEGYLFVNSSFNSDKSIEVGGYAKALTFLDIGLKEKDNKKIKLNQITDLYESATQQKCKRTDLLLPATATDKEILEFISMTYELFAYASAKKIEVVKDFYKMYKKIGMSSNFERLTGEMLDRIYLPITLLELAEAKVKKDGFQLKEEYYWDVLTPYPLEEKKPLGTFLEMQLNPRALIELLNISINLTKL